MTNVLHLTLKAQWFNLIAHGIKAEEYRAIKPHWNRRFNNREYDVIQFVNGYGNHRPKMLVELKDIVTGLGIIEWGATPGERCYILRLGRILEISNYEMQ